MTRKFAVGQVLNCPKSSLPKADKGTRWEEYMDEYSWKLVECSPIAVETSNRRLGNQELVPRSKERS